MSERFMRAYYYQFTPTGDDTADAILEAIATAGKAYHNTADWSEPWEYGDDDGPCFWEIIEQRVHAAAKVLDQDRDTLKPCPFCGGDATIEGPLPDDGLGNEGGYVVCCNRCGASSPVTFPDKVSLEAAMADVWNRRL